MKVTRKRAEAAAVKLTEHFGAEPGTFTVYEPGFHSDGWTIAAEDGAPYGWAIQAWPVLAEWQSGLFFEPVNHWCLGLYNG
jgi:hypothetical protein